MAITTSSRGIEMEVVCITLFVLCLITVSLRVYSMGFILKRFFVEDYLAILALLIFTAYTILALIGVSYGLGQHLVDLSAEDIRIATKYCFLATTLYIVLSYLTKVVVGLFLARICSASNQRWQRITIRTMLIIVGVFYTAYFFITIFACRPITYIWMRAVPDDSIKGECNSAMAATSITYIATALNCVADWMLSLLPALVVWQAKLARRTKISIVLILAFGSIASIATLVRVVYARELVSNDDALYNFVPLATWSTLEVGIALTASSLATLKPLFRNLGAIFKSTIGTTASHRQHTYSHSSSSISNRRSAFLVAQAKYARHVSDDSAVFHEGGFREAGGIVSPEPPLRSGGNGVRGIYSAKIAPGGGGSIRRQHSLAESTLSSSERQSSFAGSIYSPRVAFNATPPYQSRILRTSLDEMEMVPTGSPRRVEAAHCADSGPQRIWYGPYK